MFINQLTWPTCGWWQWILFIKDMWAWLLVSLTQVPKILFNHFNVNSLCEIRLIIKGSKKLWIQWIKCSIQTSLALGNFHESFLIVSLLQCLTLENWDYLDLGHCPILHFQFFQIGTYIKFQSSSAKSILKIPNFSFLVEKKWSDLQWRGTPSSVGLPEEQGTTDMWAQNHCAKKTVCFDVSYPSFCFC